VFEIDMEHCSSSGGGFYIISAILEAPVIERILMRLGPQARAAPRAPARGQVLQGGVTLPSRDRPGDLTHMAGGVVCVPGFEEPIGAARP
jgi:hypothetical protein